MRRREWQRGIVIGLLILVISWLAYLIWNLGQKAFIAFDTEQETKAQYEALEARRVRLEANLHDLSTPRGEDAAIREAFSVAKPGEEVIVVVPPTESTSTSAKHWWQKIWEWF